MTPTNLLKGFTPDQIERFYASGGYLTFARDQTIFSEGDRASGLYFILGGSIQVERDSRGEVVPIAKLGPGEVMGEMGLMLDTGRRTATARAIESVSVFYLPGNPIKFYKEVQDIEVAFVLLENLIAILGRRLRDNALKLKTRPSIDKTPDPRHGRQTLRILKQIRDELEISFQSGCTRNIHFDAGATLLNEGEPSDGFYYVHSGRVDIRHSNNADAHQTIIKMEAPAVVGEIGFFARKRRSSTVTADTAVETTFFSLDDLDKIRKADPMDALNILFAATQWTVLQLLDQTLSHPDDLNPDLVT